MIVPGFERYRGTLSSLLGKDAVRDVQRTRDTSRSVIPVPKERPRVKIADPIFSHPYEPGYAAIGERAAPPRRRRPIAALLGGLKPAKS